ncbi:hypothetical protein [Mesobacillus maritimus]|nr:hypothetical protein [Mesobacillus maritimus]
MKIPPCPPERDILSLSLAPGTNESETVVYLLVIQLREELS